ncbi:MAG: hypothetical protein JSW27_11695 [Phycisphaerales bacterium]|nr:MAG: hypothetical protein JSW27_11695 [Phycisphaerales bacterium]
MAVKVKLSEILDALEFLNDETEYYLDKATGRVHLLTPDATVAVEADDPIEDYPEWQREAIKIARRVEEGDDDLIGLPTQWDIHEYQIMSDFCDSLGEGTVQDALFIAIRGAGAFRRFKDAIHTFDVADDWYHYRQMRFKAIAADWCQAHALAYVDDTAKEPGPGVGQ